MSPTESNSASISAAFSDDRASTMAPQLERPVQGKFSKDEANFLSTHLPAYEALCRQPGETATGPKGKSIKGVKKDWILTKVYPKFVKEFSSDKDGGPQLQSLQNKMVRWFSNRSPLRNLGSDSTPLTVDKSLATSKRPRATNGPKVFAEEYKTKITDLMAEENEKEGGIPKLVNLTRYHKIKQQLYDQLTDKERREYEAKAAELNETRKALPERSENFKNQENLVSSVVTALNSLIGWSWGQYGEAAFFVQAAFRNADNNLKTFNVSVTPNVKTTNFSSTLPDYNTVLRAPFREWAENALPVHSLRSEGSPDVGNQKYVIELQGDGLPRLPIFDLDCVAPNDARLMLKTYIEVTWKSAIQQSIIQDEVTVPWDLLDTPTLRRELLVKPETFSHIKTLDPVRMTLREVYDVLDLLLKGQISRVQPLEFSIPDNFDSNANLQDVDMSELSATPPFKPRTASPGDIENAEDTAGTEPHTTSLREAGANNAAISNRLVNVRAEQNMESDPHPAVVPSLHKYPLSASAAASAATDLPFKSLPPSLSMTETAIQNVARAGYLSIVPHAAAINVDQTPSQQSVIVKTDSKSKKRTEMEMEQEENSRKQTKKRAKIVVPAREQSLRLKDSTYKNKHVTVRPR